MTSGRCPRAILRRAGRRHKPQLAASAAAGGAECSRRRLGVSPGIYETLHSRHSLITELQAWVAEAGAEPYPIHHAIARLPLDAIITTCYDDRLERALIAAGKTPVTVVTDVDVPFVGSGKVLVLKLFGDLAQRASWC